MATAVLGLLGALLSPSSMTCCNPTGLPFSLSMVQRSKSESLRNLKRLSLVASASPYMKVRVSWKARTTFCSPSSSASGCVEEGPIVLHVAVRVRDTRPEQVERVRGQRAHEHRHPEALQDELPHNDAASAAGGAHYEHERHKLLVLSSNLHQVLRLQVWRRRSRRAGNLSPQRRDISHDPAHRVVSHQNRWPGARRAAPCPHSRGSVTNLRWQVSQRAGHTPGHELHRERGLL